MRCADSLEIKQEVLRVHSKLALGESLKAKSQVSRGASQRSRITQRKLMFEIESQFPLMPDEYKVKACRWVFENKPGGHLSASQLADNAVRAWVRHQRTEYDGLRHRLRLEGYSPTEAKELARDYTRPLVNSIVDGWRKPALQFHQVANEA